jgi:hypothetical protein
MLGGNNISTMGVAMSLPRLRRRLRQPRTLAPKVLAPRCVISSPITMAPSWGSRFWKHTSSGIFVKIFQKRAKKQKIRVCSLYCGLTSQLGLPNSLVCRWHFNFHARRY